MKRTWKKTLITVSILGLTLGLVGCENTRFNIGDTTGDGWSIQLAGLPAALAIAGVVAVIIIIVVIVKAVRKKK